MAEQTEALVEGSTCSYGCGAYFEKPHGYPVICNRCYNKDKVQAKRDGYISKPIWKVVNP